MRLTNTILKAVVCVALFLLAFSILQLFTATQTARAAEVSPAPKTTTVAPSDNIGCSFSGMVTFEGKDWALCVSSLFYWIAALASYIAYIGAYFFSYMVQISLNSAAYSLNFISEGWVIVREIANMTFLFMLIYIALIIMLQAETSETVRMLAAVVVIALLVNFSFFFTRVVIDGGNILATQFYNSIQVTGPPLGNGTKDLTAGIMGAVKIQNIYSTPSFKAFFKNTESGTAVFITLSLIYTAAAAMYMILFFAFFYVGIKFLLRIAGLWLVIIASPIAFVCRALNPTKKYFDVWFKALISFSLYPAIFLFIFLIISRMTDSITEGNLVSSVFSDIGTQLQQGKDVSIIPGAIANIAIRMGFIIVMLYYGLKVADLFVQEGNKAAGWLSGSIAGSMGRLTAASVGYAGRQTIGRGSNALSQSVAVNKGAAQRTGGPLWRGIQRGTEKVASSSFDMRAAPGVGLLKDIAGKNIASGLGKPQGEGGFAKSFKESAAKESEARKKRVDIVRDAANREAIKRIAGGHGSADDVSRVKGFGKRELEAMKGADIERIVHLLNDKQMQTVKDSDKFSDDKKGDIRNAWNHEVINQLRSIHADLGRYVPVSTPGAQTINIPELAALTTATAGTPISAADLTNAMKAIKNEIAGVQSRKGSLTGPARVHEERNLIYLNDAEKELKKLSG